MKCEVTLAREGGYEFYTNVKCRPYPPPYYCVRVTRTPRWAEDFIYPGVLRVYDSLKVEEEHEKKYHTERQKRMQSIPYKYPGRYRKATHKAAEYVPMREIGGKSRIGHFYAVRIPVRKGFKEEKLAVLKKGDISIILKECEFGKYIEIEKPYNFNSKEMREPVNKIATKLRLRHNLFGLIVATYIKLKIIICGEIKVRKKYLK
jgi:hypothetical protein